MAMRPSLVRHSFSDLLRSIIIDPVRKGLILQGRVHMTTMTEPPVPCAVANKSGNRLLHLAPRKGAYALVRLLIRVKAYMTIRNHDGQFAINGSKRISRKNSLWMC